MKTVWYRSKKVELAGLFTFILGVLVLSAGLLLARISNFTSAFFSNPLALYSIRGIVGKASWALGIAAIIGGIISIIHIFRKKRYEFLFGTAVGMISVLMTILMIGFTVLAHRNTFHMANGGAAKAFFIIAGVIFGIASIILCLAPFFAKDDDLDRVNVDENGVATPVKNYIDFGEIEINDHIVLSLEEAGKTVESIKKAELASRIIMTIITYAFILFMALLMIFPFYWMIITSLKQNTEIEASTQTFFPTIVMWSNYVHVFQVFDFGTYMWNTIVVAFFSTAGTLITTILAAFAFARLRFKGRDAVFAIFLMTMMIPGEMMVISNYITVASFGWVGEGQTLWDAYLAMIVPFIVSVFYIYLLRQNFKQIPNELYLAAKVDGKSDWSFLWRVMVPLAAPTLISITILKFMGTWNSYVWPNLVASDTEFRLISNGLRSSTFRDVDTNRTEYGYQMAATVLVTVPLFLLFVVFRKYIMRGVGRAGIKG